MSNVGSGPHDITHLPNFVNTFPHERDCCPLKYDKVLAEADQYDKQPISPAS